VKQSDRREILYRVERQLRVEARMDDEWPGGAEQERVPVGRGLGDALGRHVAAGAGHVLDHNRLAPGFGELVADHARNRVGGTAGHKADQDAERLVGIARLRKRVARGQQRRQRGQDTDGLHRCSPVVSTDQAAEKNATAAPTAGRKSLDVLLCGAI
jgi:hypothetical protein